MVASGAMHWSHALELTAVPRRLVADMVFTNLLALFMIGLLLGGCSMQQNPAERPDWSLNATDRPATSQESSTSKKYGDWNGPGAPQPLKY